MKLKALRLNGFRGFVSEQEFRLDSDAIVVIGSNGLGKTSLLDGVLWGLSGVLPRIGGDEYLVSKYSETGLAVVQLVLLDENEGEWVIKRSTDGKNQSVSLKIGKEEFKGSSATARIIEKVWPDAQTSKDESSAIANAITRSVYLQQDLIREFVEPNDDHERFKAFCELVGTGRLNELQAQLDSQGRSWANSTSKMTRDLQPFKMRVDDLDEQLKSLVKAASIGREEDGMSWSQWWSRELRANRIGGECPSPTDVDAATKLASALSLLSATREQLRRKRIKCESFLQYLDTRPDEGPVESRDLESALLAAKADLELCVRRVNEARENAALEREAQVKASELDEQQRALARLALKLLDTQCPVCNQAYDFDATKARLETILAKIPSTSQPVTASIDELVRAEREAASRHADILRRVGEDAKRAEVVKAWKSEVSARVQELAIADDRNLPETLKVTINDLLSSELEISNQIDAGEKLSLSLARSSAEAKIELVSKDQIDAKQQFEKQSAELKRREKTHETIRYLIDAMRTANDRLAMDRLKEIEPFAQQIYSRIDPHQTFRILRFATELFRGKGRFITTLVDEDDDVSVDRPSALLSSSQLNALAVSIFLSFNLMLPRLPIDCVILDDPLKSLDDINLLGVVDLCRRVKQNRQLIVTTHDARLGKLLARKLRPTSAGQTTNVIEFQEWTKQQGPKFCQQQIEPDHWKFQFAKTG